MLKCNYILSIAINIFKIFCYFDDKIVLKILKSKQQLLSEKKGKQTWF